MVQTDEQVILERSARAGLLKPFPLVACRMLDLINDENVSFRDAARVLQSDAAFSAQVLRAANSALWGARFEVTSILQALSVIGVDRLRSLVVTVAMNQYLNHSEDLHQRRCWRHNLGTALWAEVLAEYFNIERPLGYTAGLLHDIGRGALLTLFPEGYAALIDDITVPADRWRETERRLCDVDHCRIGGYLAASWQFPGALEDVIAHHHDPVTAATPRLRLLVEAACMAASMSGFRAAGAPREWKPERIAGLVPVRGIGLMPGLESLLEKVTTRFHETENSLL